MPNPRWISIDGSGNVSSQDDQKHISKANDEAAWRCLDGGEFTIQFEPPGPFQSATFTVTPSHPTHSGRVVRGNPGDQFPYTITSSLGSTDPRVIIDN
jgi:hypothetical protein